LKATDSLLIERVFRLAHSRERNSATGESQWRSINAWRFLLDPENRYSNALMQGFSSSGRFIERRLCRISLRPFESLAQQFCTFWRVCSCIEQSHSDFDSKCIHWQRMGRMALPFPCGSLQDTRCHTPVGCACFVPSGVQFLR